MQRDMSAHMSAQRKLEVAVTPAVLARVDGFFEPDHAECGVGPGACALEADPGAVIAAWCAGRTGPQRLLGLVRAGFVLRQVAFKLRILRFYIAAAGFKCRLLGLHEPDVLAQHRRTAVLVDQFLQQFEWSHGLPMRVGGVGGPIGQVLAAGRGVRDAA